MALTKYNADGFHYWMPERKLGGGWICYKSSPSAPPPPDPNVTSAAQTASNVNTAKATSTLNNTNQQTPWGNLTYTQAPGVNGQPGQWTANTQLSPAEQQLLTSQQTGQQSMANLANGQIGNVANSMSTPLNFNSSPGVQTGGMQSTLTPNNINLQSGVNTSGLPQLVGGSDLTGAMNTAQQAAYKQQTAYLDPQYANQQHDLTNQLTQQGIMQNSDAWNRAMDDFGRQKTQAYQNANDNSVAQGNAAEAQLYGQGLSSNQNAFSQAMGNANLANTASAQQAQQNLASMMAQNSAQNQQFGQSLAARNQYNNELMTLQQNPLNMYNALRTGSQVQAPGFGGTPQTNVAPTDVMSAYNNAFNGQMGAYNGQIANNNANTSAAASIGSAALMAMMA